jgi:hypothetical protein
MFWIGLIIGFAGATFLEWKFGWFARIMDEFKKE